MLGNRGLPKTLQANIICSKHQWVRRAPTFTRFE